MKFPRQLSVYTYSMTKFIFNTSNSFGNKSAIRRDFHVKCSFYLWNYVRRTHNSFFL